MRNKKGFTLIELLAVIIILGIIMVITIPVVNRSVENRRKNSFFVASKSILRDVEYDKWSDTSFDYASLSTLDVSNASGTNYDLVNSYVYFQDGVLKINLVGKGKFDGLYACGVYENSKQDVVIGTTPCTNSIFLQVADVGFSINGTATYAKSKSIVVTVEETNLNMSSLKYQWSTSTTIPLEGSFSTSFTNGATINTPSGVTGRYYLWVLAKDINNVPMIVRSKVFNLDNVSPVITRLGDSTVSVNLGTDYTDAGATATDNIDNNITSDIVLNNPVNTNVAGTYTVTYNVSDSAGNTATQVTRTVNVVVSYCYDYNYTGNVQTFNIAMSGVYLLEVWGAEGGGSRLSGNTASGAGGMGGYATGMVSLNVGDVLNIYVGGTGLSTTTGVAAGGWNGGGTGCASSSSEPGNGGGGATDIRVNGTSLNDRIIVAGGGGGGGEDNGDICGHGGGEVGASYPEYDAIQSAAGGGGDFGIGGSTINGDGGGGGGGWYGGGTLSSTTAGTDTQGGGGGSGYVFTSTSFKPAGYAPNTRFYLTTTSLIAGNLTMPNPVGGTEVGHQSNGHARITLQQ